MNVKIKTVLVVGAGSGIGRATAFEYAAAGWNVMLSARTEETARRTADDIAARSGRQVATTTINVLDLHSLPGVVTALPVLPDTVICVVGDLGQQSVAEKDIVYAAQVLRANFEGPALLLGLFAEAFLQRNSGVIVGVSSVAGDRGRGSNYIYGSAKAGMTAFLSGLRSRLSRTPVRVVTIKPGFVRTRMTAGLSLPGPLTADPGEVARAIFRRAETTRREVVYVRPVWRFIMLAIRLLPERVFKRLTF